MGLLLRNTEGNIMQLLEDEAALVHQLFDVIAANTHHRNVVKLTNGPVPSRALADWSMQSRSVEPADFLRLTFPVGATPEHVCNLVLLCSKSSWLRSRRARKPQATSPLPPAS